MSGSHASLHPPQLAGGVGLEPFARTADGQPILPNTPSALYAFGSLIRGCELAILDLFRRNLVSGTTHTCFGQELCQMAVVRTLTHPGDSVWSNHRNHGHFLTYTGDFAGLVAEVMGRRAGVCGGAGGSQHLAFRSFRSNGVQGGLTAAAVGFALWRKLRGEEGVAAIFIGDGTLGEGLLYESMNLASVWDVPAVFVVENNGVAQTTPTSATIGGGSILARGEAFGLRSRRLDDADPELFEEAEAIVDEVRRSRQPAFLVIDTARLGPHSKGDDFRDAGELARLHARDPLSRLGEQLARSERRRIDQINTEYLEDIQAIAAISPESRAESRAHIFTTERVPAQTPAARDAGGTMRASLNAALHRLLSSDPRVVLLGEDLHDPYGGAFKVTAGLSTACPGRVISTPISEAAIAGAGIGLALGGARPVVEVMFADFIALAMDQLLNHAVKLAGAFPNDRVPLVIRTACGGRRGYGATHSQSTETLAAAVPGLTVIAPSHRHDAGLLLERAVRDWPYPSVFFEHKTLYGVAREAAGYEVLRADARDPAAHLFPTLVRGDARADVTLVTYGGMAPVVEAVAARLEAEEIAIRVAIVSLLSPLPCCSLTSLLLGGCTRIVAVEESHEGYGFGAELGARLMEAGYTGRFVRVATPPVPIPAARTLESDVLPNEDLVCERVLAMIEADACETVRCRRP